MHYFRLVVQSLLTLFLVIAVSCVVIYQLSRTHMPLRALVGEVSVDLLPPTEAQQKVQQHYKVVPQHIITLQSADKKVASISSTSAELNARFDTTRLFTQFEQIHGQKLSIKKIYDSISFFLSDRTVSVPVVYDEAKLREFISLLKTEIDIPALPPKAELKVSGAPQTLTVFPGKRGQELQIERTLETLTALHTGSSAVVTPVVETVGIELDPAQTENAKTMYALFVGKSIQLTAERFSQLLTDQKILSLIFPTGKLSHSAYEAEVDRWRTLIETPPIEPVLTYDPTTLKVTTFTPPREGRTIDMPALEAKMNEHITTVTQQSELTPVEKKVAKQTNISIPLKLAPPQNSLGSLNSLGITERIGFGESYYAHSIPNRIHNVAITTERINTVIVRPGEEFSFNKTVGDVSAATGYRSAYVIKNGQTSLGDGGGVCQVSTTLFRSVLNAGLTVTKRLPHSYRVSYYELDSKPGVDATVYSGETDFRFINDTDHHILVHAQADSKKLYMYVELYGTSDGRSAEIVDHKTWNYRAPLATQYISDPTLPPGKLVQVDWSAAGIDASFKNVIKNKDGTIIREDTYVSKYRPWAAKYLKGV